LHQKPFGQVIQNDDDNGNKSHKFEFVFHARKTNSSSSQVLFFFRDEME
jgi:hypothetical protein